LYNDIDILTLISSWRPYGSLTVANLVPSWHKVFSIIIVIIIFLQKMTHLQILQYLVLRYLFLHVLL